MFPPVRLPSSIRTCTSLRLHKVHAVPKTTAEDTALTTQDADGNKVVVPVPQGTGIVLHVPGLHYNRTLSSLSAAKGGP